MSPSITLSDNKALIATFTVPVLNLTQVVYAPPGAHAEPKNIHIGEASEPASYRNRGESEPANVRHRRGGCFHLSVLVSFLTFTDCLPSLARVKKQKRTAVQ
jgi:hypothetical protein